MQASMISWRQNYQEKKYPNPSLLVTCESQISVYQYLFLLLNNIIYAAEKLFSQSIRQSRKDFITAKYTEKRFAQRRRTDATAKLRSLYDAVKSRDIFTLLQVYADGVDLTDTFPMTNEHVSYSGKISIFYDYW